MLKVMPEGFDLTAEVAGLGREEMERMVEEVGRVIGMLQRVAEALGARSGDLGQT